MNARAGTWIPSLVAATVLAAVIAWQRGAGANTRRHLEALRVAELKLEAVEQENRALAALGVSQAELDALRADHAALVRLRSELDSLRAAARAKTARPARMERPAEVLAPAWAAVGCGTPVDALRTAVWSMASGELTTFADRIVVAPPERALMEAIFSQLPADVQTRYPTLEAWIAAATARTMPIGSLKVMQQNERGPDEVELMVQLQGRRRGAVGSMETRSAQLVMLRGADGWRFVVPLTAVQQFAESDAIAERGRPKS